LPKGTIKEDKIHNIQITQHTNNTTKNQEQSETTYSAKENMGWIQNPVWIRTADLDSGSGLLPKFNGDFLVQGYIGDKIFMNIRSLSPEI